MNNTSKFIIFIIIALVLWFCFDKFLGEKMPILDVINPAKKEKTQTPKPEVSKLMDNETPSKQEEQKVQNNKIYIYLLITDKSGNQFLKPVLRTLPPKEEPLYFAINQLIQGPNAEEQKQGAYTEIPKDTKILGIVSKENSVIIDLSNTFQFGGGSDSTYARVRQLIKTVLANTNKPAYLYIEGKKADIIGGEGITLTQPLSEKSLDE